MRIGIARSLILIGATAGLPVLGANWRGRELRHLLQFPPPLDVPVHYPRFSWIAVVLALAPFVSIAVAWTRSFQSRDPYRPVAAPSRSFPVWGWCAAAWMIMWWFFAWTRLRYFEPIQRYTFFPLWIGFIVTVNAVSFSRTGTCRMVRTPRRWIGLFAASALFWWSFEWLNRFTRNWHYLGVSDFGPVLYALHATLCFSTVLPAVAAMAELLATNGGWRAITAGGPRLRWITGGTAGIILAIIGVLGLLGAGAAPLHFYAALWVAPLALLLASETTHPISGIGRELASGNWQTLANWSGGALACGLFWELWNIRSAAKWIYTVPYVERWHVFAMPLLGYLGYLPFGLECYFVAALIRADDVPFSNASST